MGLKKIIGEYLFGTESVNEFKYDINFFRKMSNSTSYNNDLTYTEKDALIAYRIIPNILGTASILYGIVSGDRDSMIIGIVGSELMRNLGNIRLRNIKEKYAENRKKVIVDYIKNNMSYSDFEKECSENKDCIKEDSFFLEDLIDKKDKDDD